MRVLNLAKLTLTLACAVIVTHTDVTHAQTFAAMSYNDAGTSSATNYQNYRRPNYARTVPRTAPTGRPYGNLVNPSGYGPARHAQLAPASGLNAYYQQARPVHTHYQTASQPPQQKPFSNITHSPNAFQRYWPLMLQARVDLKTGTAYIGL